MYAPRGKMRGTVALVTPRRWGILAVDQLTKTDRTLLVALAALRWDLNKTS
jgi:hypothetical protein